MKTTFATAAVAASLLLSGCATSPTSIKASYVSPVPYQAMNCSQLTQEAQRVSGHVAEVTGVQNQKAGRDAVAMTVGMVVFWPALFFIGGDQGNAAELASLKGQMDAIEAVNAEKNCGIQFAAS
jgi:hypothetical protein